MNPITLPIHGLVYRKGDEHALLLDDGAAPAFLRFALITRGAERHIFPALVLDDWGREKKGPGLYRWLYEEGPRYPRAELFGFDEFGDETQLFLRDLELSFRLPCYLSASAAIPTAARLQTIFVSSERRHLAGPLPPPDLPFPLHRAALQWLYIEPDALHEQGWRPQSAA